MQQEATCCSSDGILSLPSDVLQHIARPLAEECELLTFAMTCKTFDAARRRERLPLTSDGRLFVRRLRLLEWAVSHAGWLDISHHQSYGCLWAAEVGCLPTILWLRGEGYWMCGEDCLASAARGGHHDTLIALWASGCTSDWRACANAAAEGRTTTVQIARRLGFEWNEMTCAHAASTCAHPPPHTPTPGIFPMACTALLPHRVLSPASRSGSLALLQWLRRPSFAHLPHLATLIFSTLASPGSSPGTSPTPARRADAQAATSPPTTTSLVISDPPLESLSDVLLATSPYSSPSSAAIGSPLVSCSPSPPSSSPPSPPPSPLGWRAPYRARHGQRPSLPPVDPTPCPWDAWTVAAAAVHGHLDVLEWIYSLEEEARPPIDGRACECAAAGGHLDVLRWLRARHAPWDENTCGEAAGNGHLDILQWCRRHGCPWDEDVVQRAREGGFEAVATWALQHGCPPPPQPVG